MLFLAATAWCSGISAQRPRVCAHVKCYIKYWHSDEQHGWYKKNQVNRISNFMASDLDQARCTQLAMHFMLIAEAGSRETNSDFGELDI